MVYLFYIEVGMKKKTKIIILCVCALLAVGGIVAASIVLPRYIKDQKLKKLTEEYYNMKVASFEKENPTLSGADVVFLGDSLTDGCDLNKYYPLYTTVNRGISGDTTDGLLNRLKVSAYDVEPTGVVLLIGVNDISRGVKPNDLSDNYEKIITGLKENLPDTIIIWCSMTALGGKSAKYNDTVIICNQKIKLLAEKHGCVFVDLFTPLCDVETREIKEEYTVDGTHLTDAGYQVVSREVKKALEEYLGR